MIKDKVVSFVQSILSGISIFWMCIEAHNALDQTNIWNINFYILLLVGVCIGTLWFFINGIFLQGFLKSSIEIRSNALQTNINVKFGDIFSQQGFIAISVNDFFDSLVDDKHISSNSLHGKMLKKYWAANTTDWDIQIENQLKGVLEIEELKRKDNAKSKRYEIGTTVITSIGPNKFLCTVLTKTNIDNLECNTSLDDFLIAIQSMLIKARSVCSGEPLNIPLLGSGLSRTGIKENIIIDLILLVIFSESKKAKITDNINIILPKAKRKDINLLNILEDWS